MTRNVKCHDISGSLILTETRLNWIKNDRTLQMTEQKNVDLFRCRQCFSRNTKLLGITHFSSSSSSSSASFTFHILQT